MVPPAIPTTTASTTAPDRSSRLRTPAMPPLRPNTKVPTRLRTSRSVGSNPGSSDGDAMNVWATLRREPGAAGGYERLDSGLERWVDDRREPRVVVGGQF